MGGAGLIGAGMTADIGCAMSGFAKPFTENGFGDGDGT